jgi:hypothetical protein
MPYAYDVETSKLSVSFRSLKRGGDFSLEVAVGPEMDIDVRHLYLGPSGLVEYRCDVRAELEDVDEDIVEERLLQSKLRNGYIGRSNRST